MKRFMRMPKEKKYQKSQKNDGPSRRVGGGCGSIYAYGVLAHECATG